MSKGGVYVGLRSEGRFTLGGWGDYIFANSHSGAKPRRFEESKGHSMAY